MKRIALVMPLAAAAAFAAAPDPRNTPLHKAAYEARSEARLEYGAAPPSGIGGPIDLVDDRGTRFTNARLHGQPALVFFGFMHCGASCPMALATAKQLLAQESVMRAPSIFFVTLDPLHDDPASLHRFLASVDQRLIGLTGSTSQVEDVADRFGVGIRRTDGRLEHSSMWYLLDGSGRVRRVYGIDTPAPQLARDFNQLAQETSGDIR
jgi:protein SCO1/2